MKTLSNRKLPLLALAAAIGTALTGTLLAQAGNPEQAVREMNIMRNIFGATLEDDNGRQRWRMSEPDALYLSGQGMVFTFDMPGGGFFFGFQNPMPPMPPINVNGGDFDYDFDFDVDIDIDDDDDLDQATREQIDSYQRQLRDLNEQIRDKEEEIRDRQREMRRIERDREDDNAAANDTEMANLREQIEALDGELRAQANSYTQLAQEFQTQRNAQAQARRDEQTAVIFSTLCDYGGTLKSLASGEHVNLVFRHYVDDQDQVYVIEQSAVASCSSGASLQQGAVSYQVPN